MRRGKHRALVVWEGGKGYQLLTMSCSKSTTNELRCETGVGDGSKRRTVMSQSRSTTAKHCY